MQLTSSQGRALGLLRGPWDSGVPAGQRPQWKAGGAGSQWGCQPGPSLSCCAPQGL